MHDLIQAFVQPVKDGESLARRAAYGRSIMEAIDALHWLRTCLSNLAMSADNHGQAAPSESAERIAAKAVASIQQVFGNAEAARPWKPGMTAPQNATWIEVILPDGTVVNAHWACDESGEDQPPFRGWFVQAGASFRQVPSPVFWRPLL